ncbi:MAG: hypothetical protein MHM6MM_009462, partial [Cercozoa sp. M6MM]
PLLLVQNIRTLCLHQSSRCLKLPKGVWFWRRDEQTSRHPCLRDLTVGDIRAHWAIQVTHVPALTINKCISRLPKDAKHHHIDFRYCLSRILSLVKYMYDFRRSDDPLYSSSASTLRRPFQMLVHLCASHRKTLLKILRGHYDKVSWNAPTLASAVGADKIPKATFSSSVAGQPDGTAAKLVLIRTGMDCNAYFTQVSASCSLLNP